MKKNFIFLSVYLLLVFPDFLIAQAGIFTNGANIIISSGTFVNIPGNVRVSPSTGGTDYIKNDGTVTLSGNFTNYGNSYDVTGFGLEVFNSTTTINGTKNSNFNNFQILPGATVTLSKSIDIKNNWTNNGLFVHGGNIVTFSGTVPVQYIFGSGTFYDLKLQNAVHFTSSKDTIDNSFSNSATGMVDGTSRVVFRNNSSIIADKSKYFYDLEILSGANVLHTTGGGNIHVAHSFINNGISFTENPGYTFYFDSSGITEIMSGSGATTFGNLGIGFSTLTAAVSLNTGLSNFTIGGDSVKFKSNGSSLASAGTITFSKNTSGTISILNASSVSGTASFYNVNIDSVISVIPIATALNFGSGIATINNNLTLNPGGSVTINSPFYGNAATLIYNTTSPGLNTGLEWLNNTVTPGGLGAPNNVSIQNDNIILNASPASRTVPGILNLDATGTLAINGNTLTVNSGFTGVGGLKGSTTSNLVAGGTGAINFVKYLPANQLKTLTINNAADLSLGGNSAVFDTLNIVAGNSTDGYGTVTINGNGKLDANGILTLRSSSNGTARVAYSSGILNGDVTVERQVPARRAWRFLAAPFIINSSTQTIHDAWQEGVNNYCLDPLLCNVNPKPGYGTHITGNNVSTDGFDFNTTTNPSMKVWDSTANNWNINEPHTISTNITSYRAYCLFVRGSRAVDLSQANYATADSTVLRVKGTLNQTGLTSTQSYLGTSGKIIFVGNPYASSIDLSTALPRSSGISGSGNVKFWVWDPKANGQYGVGKYVTYSNSVQAPPDTSYLYTADNIIQSGQAFMVQLNNSPASLNFQESDKVSSETNIFGKHAKQTYPVIYTNLLDTSMSLTDGVGTAFANKFSEKVDADDADKQWNFDENIALARGLNTLAIEFRPEPKLTDTLFYRLYLRKGQPYILQFFTQNFETMPVVRAWVIDKYLNTKTEINLPDTFLYKFNTNTDTNSYRNRFMLVFNKQLETNPVPVTHLINQQDPNTSGIANNISGKATIKIFPNPVKQGGSVIFKLSNITDGIYQAEVLSVDGKKIKVSKIIIDKSSSNYSLLLPSTITSGIYNLRLIDGNGNITASEKLVVGN